MARPGLTGHRKFRRLARALGSPLLARGALELLWDSCYESGEDYVGTSQDIEALVGWTGEPAALTRALIEAGVPEGFGFIEPVGEATRGETSYRVHDLWHHAPDYVAKRRRRELDRQQKADPAGDCRTAPNGGRWTKTSDCQIEVDRTPSPSPSPSHSPSHKNGAAAASDSPLRKPFEACDGDLVLTFPIVGLGSKTWGLMATRVEEWQQAFPGVDIEAEARKALAWVNADLGRRKTGQGMARFLVGWFARSVNQGTAVRASRQTRAPSKEWLCPDDPPCRPGTTAYDCHIRAVLEQARRERKAAVS